MRQKTHRQQTRTTTFEKTICFAVANFWPHLKQSLNFPNPYF